MRAATIAGCMIGLIGVFGAGSTSAQGTGAQNTGAYPWAEQMFEKLNHDFGVVASGADMKHRLKITNKYEQKVHIAGIATSCGCTVAKPAKDTLASGESTYLDITMNTRKGVSHKEIRLTVTFDQPAFAQAVIRVTAVVNTDVVVNPGEADFGSVYKGAEKNLRLAFMYNGKGRTSVTKLICKNPNLSAKLVPTRQEGTAVHYELDVTLKSSAPLGELRDQLVIVTDDAANPHIPILVEARVEPEYSVTPELVSFGNLAPGERRTLNVVVRGKDPFTIEKIESEKSYGTFETVIPKQPKKTHVLPLTIIAPAEGGDVSEEFSVVISGRKEPLTFKAYGKIVGSSGGSASAARAFTPANPR